MGMPEAGNPLYILNVKITTKKQAEADTDLNVAYTS